MKIYVIGDSISIQYGPHLEKYLDGFADYSRKEGVDEALLDLDTPQGANGGDSRMVRAYLAQRLRKNPIQADVLLLNCGLHDIKTNPETGAKQVELPQYQDNLRAIIRLVAGMKPGLVWIRTTPCDEKIHNRRPDFHRFAADVRAYNEAADNIMAEAGIPIIDLYTFTANLGDDLYCDHVHFKEHIREKQAAFIAGWIAGITA
ncbi:MAG: hypothetical protein K9M45_04505 [Kiritimatiellales bacterium]|nr:hypothetical protein [Kiritimatiellales bacterium]